MEGECMLEWLPAELVPRICMHLAWDEAAELALVSSRLGMAAQHSIMKHALFRPSGWKDCMYHALLGKVPCVFALCSDLLVSEIGPLQFD
ncbi:hypothetical protein FVE85_3892 [Porphyridium purpureum]|uniref:F-box domain-containing protein n=1 Tax=Porphyridium purpureum TaxID=35688 RepID=A0A5J4YU29_PORPP|nr:hypothetical protein FVE85_3892 [Porphyridium purpureum]|eukprot:POR2838..scf229_5